MSANRCARGVLFFLVLVLTGSANLLFFSVDTDGDEETPPLIVSFKFVTPRSTGTTYRSHAAEKTSSTAKPVQPKPAAPSAKFSVSIRLNDAEPLTPLITPLRC